MDNILPFSQTDDDSTASQWKTAFDASGASDGVIAFSDDTSEPIVMLEHAASARAVSSTSGWSNQDLASLMRAKRLLDMAGVNSWIHYKLVHHEVVDSDESSYHFFDTLADSFMETDWEVYIKTELGDRDDTLLHSLVNDDDHDECR